MDVLPCGLFVSIPGIKKNFYLNLVPFLIEKSEESDGKITSLPNGENVFVARFLAERMSQGWSTYIGKVKRVKPDDGYFAAHPEDALELLTIEEDYFVFARDHFAHVYGSVSIDSIEFQELLCLKKELIQNRRVQEIGVGTGANMVLAMKFGARSFIGTDKSILAVTLSKWNLQYAVDTSIIPESAKEHIQILHQEGFASDADIFLFNTPAIDFVQKKETPQAARLSHRDMSISMSKSEFEMLFEELTRRLNQPGKQAIWRFVFSFSPEEWASKGIDITDYRVKARQFLENASVRFEFLETENGWNMHCICLLKGMNKDVVKKGGGRSQEIATAL